MPPALAVGSMTGIDGPPTHKLVSQKKPVAELTRRAITHERYASAGQDILPDTIRHTGQNGAVLLCVLLFRKFAGFVGAHQVGAKCLPNWSALFLVMSRASKTLQCRILAVRIKSIGAHLLCLLVVFVEALFRVCAVWFQTHFKVKF